MSFDINDSRTLARIADALELLAGPPAKTAAQPPKTIARPTGCKCHWTPGDSDCPVHDQSPQPEELAVVLLAEAADVLEDIVAPTAPWGLEKSAEVTEWIRSDLLPRLRAALKSPMQRKGEHGGAG